MDEKILDWLSERFGDELKKKVPGSAVLGAILVLLLFWAGEVGTYKSALLGLLHLRPADLTGEEIGLGQLPFMIFMVSILAALLAYALLKQVAKAYFRFICNLGVHRLLIESMVNDHRQQTKKQTVTLLHELRAAQLELEQRRQPVRQWIQAYYCFTLIGLAMLVSAFGGNELDAAVGIIFLLGGSWSLYKSVGVFLANVSPWHAKVKALTELITDDNSNAVGDLELTNSG